MYRHERTLVEKRGLFNLNPNDFITIERVQINLDVVANFLVERMIKKKILPEVNQ